MKYHPVSLALGGGGLKGVAHLGILKVFEKEGYPIKYISGSSAGALIGSLYALGYSTDELLEIALEYAENPPIDFKIRPLVAFEIFIKTVLNWLKVCKQQPTKKGLVDGKQLDRYLAKLVGDTGFDRLKYPLMITAVDLKSGRLQVFTTPVLGKKLALIHDIDCYTDVSLATAVRASIAIPGIIPPVDYDGKILVDGGVKDNVPADLLRFADAKKVIAVDLGLSTTSENDFDTLLEIILQTVEIMGNEMTDLVTERYANLVIRPNLGEIALTDAYRIREIYQIGYEIGKRKTRAIQSLLKIDK